MPSSPRPACKSCLCQHHLWVCSRILASFVSYTGKTMQNCQFLLAIGHVLQKKAAMTLHPSHIRLRRHSLQGLTRDSTLLLRSPALRRSASPGCGTDCRTTGRSAQARPPRSLHAPSRQRARPCPAALPLLRCSLLPPVPPPCKRLRNVLCPMIGYQEAWQTTMTVS